MIDQYNVWLIYTRKTMKNIVTFPEPYETQKTKRVDLWKIYDRNIFYNKVFLFHIPITYIEIRYGYDLSYFLHVKFISYSRFNKSQENKCLLHCRLNIFLLRVTEDNQLQVYYHDSHGRISQFTKINNC